MPAPFRFDTVLRVREAERDRCRAMLVQEQMRRATITAERDRVASKRASVLEELQQLQSRNEWSAENALVLRQFAEHLATEHIRIEVELSDIAIAVSRCLRELTAANTAVRGLEKLAGRHLADQIRLEQKSAERDREESWRAA